MADDNFSHLWIPRDRVRIEQITLRGGGDTYHRDDLKTHSKSLLELYRRSIKSFESKRDADIASDLIVQISTATDRPVTKERQHLRNLGFEIIAFSPNEPNVAIARIPRSSLPSLSKKLSRYAETLRHIGKSNLAAIEGIAPVGVSQKLDPIEEIAKTGEPLDCLIALYASLPEDMKYVIAYRIVEFLKERGKEEVIVHSFVNGSVSVSARLNLSEMEQISEQFMFIRAIEANGEFIMESAMPADPVPRLIEISPVRCTTPVAVIDSGVAACPLTNGLVLDTINELPPGSVGPHMSHGTFVASRIIYGDEITTVLAHRALPWCPIIDIQVTGDDGIGNRISQNGARLGEILQRVVPLISNRVRVFNLSLGISPISEGFFSSLARLIDFLSKEYQVLFVISAGNINDASAPPPAHYLSESSRILTPGESILSLTVGSIARYSEVGCVSREREISPFSRRGPGADRALKPELAAHGGNVFYTGPSWSTSPRTAVYGLSRDGSRLEYSIGTSFSAPIVAQYAARLFDAYPQATPNLIRALLCHFSDPVIAPTPGAPIDDHHFCGFGEPQIERALFATTTSATLLHQGEIKDNTYIYIPFHIPEALAGRQETKLNIKATVVFDPPVSPDDSVQYSLCRISAKLRKRVSQVLDDVSVGGDDEDALFPWNPILHFTHTFRHGYASGEWELRLRLMTRGNIPEDFMQSFSVVLEITDQNGGTDVRRSILTEFPGIYHPVVLRIAA
jgi:hypothetical protein